MGDDLGEGDYPLPGEERLPGEGRPQFGTVTTSAIPEVIKEKKLTFDDASKCLNTLGKDETGSRYAYLMITAIDRKLTDVSIILNFKHVLFLDLSGNYLTMEALQVLTAMPYLILLKAERNRVESASLSVMYYLQVLDLNQNQIKNVENISQPILDCLQLNYNDIYTTRFDTANLDNLKQLELRSNLLFEISGVYPPQIEKLYMAANKITAINSSDFANLSHLQILHLRENNLEHLDGFSENLKSLNYLNLRNNKIKKFKEFEKLKCLPNLETLIVSGNPLPGSERQADETGERGGFLGEGGKARDPVIIPLLVILPKLKRINKTLITLQDRIEAEDLHNDVIEALLADEESAIQETDRTSTTLPSSDNKEDSDV